MDGDLSAALAGLDAQARGDPIARHVLARLRRHPSGHAAGSGPPPRIGDPLLVAASEGGGSTWTLATTPDEDAVPMGRTARETWVEAAQLAALHLPLLVDPEALGRRSPPDLLPHSPYPDVDLVDGPSFGLAFVLAQLSRAAAAPLDADLVATAAVGRDGRVEAVDGLGPKLAALRAWAPGVWRVLVARSQVDEATALAGGLEILGIERIEEASALAFRDHPLALAPTTAWPDAAARARAAQGYFRLATQPPRESLRWTALAVAADALAARSEGVDRWRAAFAASVAHRHDGRAVPVPTAPPGLLRGELEVVVLAHRVQAVTDGVTEDWEPVAAEAEARLPPPGREYQADLRLLGALGRLYAAWGHAPRARELLGRALAGWTDLDREDDASYPLSELLRLEGVAGDAAALAALAARVGEQAGRPGEAYVRLAAGVGWALCGDPDRAAGLLDGRAFPWERSAAHVQASRLRWLARIDPAGPHLSALAAAARVDPRQAFAWILARIDRGDTAAADEMDEDKLRLYRRGQRVAGPRAAEVFPY